MRTYDNIPPVDKQYAERVFDSNDVEKICEAMVGVAFYEQDWKWAQDKYLDLFKSDNPDISGLAATCLGHIARIHHKIEKEKVVNALRARINNNEIAGRIEDALEDIEKFA